MKKLPKITLPCAILLALGLLITPSVGGDAVARYGGEFMAWGGGARALALGRAHTALEGGAWSLFWNPGQLASLQRTEVGLMHSERFAGVVDFDAVAFGMPQTDGSVLGAGVIRLGVNGVPFTRLNDPGSPVSEDNRVEVDKVVNEGEYAFFVSKADRWKQWSWGIAPKLLIKHIGQYRAYGLGIDVGASGRPLPSVPITTGLAVRDVVSSPLAWEQTGRKEFITPTIRFGVASGFEIKPLEATIYPAVDVEYRTENLGDSDAASLHYGLEYQVREIVALRAGSDDGRLAFGGGILLRPLSLDYAYTGHDDLGETHRVSVSVRWD